MKLAILFLTLLATCANAYDYVLTDGTNIVGSDLRPILISTPDDTKADLNLYYSASITNQLFAMNGWFMDAFVNTDGVDQASSTGILRRTKSYQNAARALTPYAGIFSGVVGAGNNVYTGKCWGSYQPIANGSFSLALWFKFATFPATQTVFFSASSSSDASHYGFVVDYGYVSASKLNFTIPGGISHSFTWTPDTNWHHCVATYTNIATTGMQLWLDGVRVVQGSAAANPTNKDDRVAIACHSYGGYTLGLNGNMDQVLIYNRSVQPAEIAYLYNDGFGRYHDTTTNFNGVVSGFEFDEAAGVTLTDFSANSWNAGSTGTIGRAASDLAIFNAATNMELQTVALPYSRTSTSYRTFLLANTTNVSQKVSVDGSTWQDVVLQYIGTTSLSPTQKMYSASGLISTNASSTTNIYLKTLCNSNTLNTIYGHGITYQ
jgi:hypothetical protein